MNLKKITIIFILALILAPTIFVALYYYNNRLFLFEAQILWGSKNFNEVEFRNGASKTRASMSVDIIRSKKLIGERCASLPERLGERTGDYYHSDGNFTYKLTERPSANWILTLTCDGSGRIEHIFIRKSCCSISQQLIQWGLETVFP